MINDGSNPKEMENNENAPKLSATMKRALGHDLATMYQKISNMDLKKIKHRHRWLKHEDESDIDSVRKKLKQCLAGVMTKHVNDIYKNDNVLPYYVVVDFEATCEAENAPNYHHEIIEFPAVLVNSATMEIEDTFQRFCRPTLKNKLSTFCTELTGITQKQIDEAEPFYKVLKLFENWLEKHKLGSEREFAIVTDGPCDMCRFLFVQCVYSNVDYPEWAKQWVDLKKIFRKFYNVERSYLKNMLEHLRMSFEGRPHSGIDDATNIARVLLRVICDGAVLLPTDRILTDEMTSILDSLDPNTDLVPQLSKLNIEPKREAILPKIKLTYNDVKKARSSKIHALTKSLNDEKTDVDAILANVQQDFEKLAIKSHQQINKKKKTKKKKRNFK